MKNINTMDLAYAYAYIITILVSDNITVDAARILAALTGWRLVKRGNLAHFIEDRGNKRLFRFEAKLAGV